MGPKESSATGPEKRATREKRAVKLGLKAERAKRAVKLG
jgi:hypothetical protein